ncbi:MAG: TIGR03546 family protein [Planctomycetales bacterium]|nr:TIGR03546 family protein [Planctomycetales bacterium]
MVKTLTAADSPRQIAWGFALGMLIGLVPKGNLLAATLGMLLVATRLNLGAAALAAFLFTWIGHGLDPISHRVGLALLENSWLKPLWAWLYGLPLAPWTALNNTVVMGSFALGLAALAPTYFGVRRAASRVLPRIRQRLLKYHIGKVLLGLEIAAGGGSA